MDMIMLVLFNFETGDSSVPLWTETAMVKGTRSDVLELEDSIASYCDAVEYEDSSYTDIITDVLNASGMEWSPISWNHLGGIPGCDAVISLYI